VTWENLKAFKDQLSTISKTLRETRARTVAQLSGFYLLDMRSFGGVNDRILKQSEKLTHFLEGEGSTLQKARSLTSSLNDAEATRNEISETYVAVAQLGREREIISATTATLSTRLVQVENDPLVKELLATEKNLRNESLRFKTQHLAHLKRPLRRLRDLSQRGEVPLASDAREALAHYIESPYRSFISDGTGSYFSGIMESLRAATSSGKLGFKPRKAARVLAQLDQISSSNETGNLQADGRRLLARRRELIRDPNCKTLYESRRDIIREIAKAKGEMEDVLQREQVLRTRSEQLNNRLGEILGMLETKTKQYTGREIELTKPLATNAPSV